MITSVILLIVCIFPCPPVLRLLARRAHPRRVLAEGDGGGWVGGWVGRVWRFGRAGRGGVWGEGVVWNHKYELHC